MTPKVATKSNESIADPIEYFLNDQRFHGKSDRTIDAYEHVLRRFETFVRSTTNEPSIVFDEIERRTCMEWVHSLRGNLAPSTIATYATYVNRFYSYMSQIGAFETNPMPLVIEEMSESIDSNPLRRELSIDQMRGFVNSITHPLEYAVVLTLLKTGMRVGELCNLDTRDVNIRLKGLEMDTEDVRAQLDGRPQSIYVDSKPARGRRINGEVRTASNKRKRSTIIPIDVELHDALIKWLAICPDPISPATPLFINTRESWGARLRPTDVRYIVERHARQHGWYHTGGGAEENVTPHYFRHFFTTHLRDRTGDRGVVKYLRGDVASDVIDTYTHNWGDRVRITYEANIYSLRESP